MVNNLKKPNIFILAVSLIISLNCRANVLPQYNLNLHNNNVDNIIFIIDGNFETDTFEEVIFNDIQTVLIHGDFICQNASKIVIMNNTHINIDEEFIVNPNAIIEIEEGSSLRYNLRNR